MKNEEFIFTELSLSDLNKNLLEDFNRYQKVEKCWRKVNSQWELKQVPFIEKWDDERKQQIVEEFYDCMLQGGIVLGVFCQNKLVGFSSIVKPLFGSCRQYIELKMLHISFECRNKGLGKKLFLLTADKARKVGAQKLYISAHSSEESQGFYRSIGCVDAVEINTRLAELEPFDCQMEYVL